MAPRLCDFSIYQISFRLSSALSLGSTLSSSTFWAVQHSLFISGGTADLQRSSFLTGRSESQSLLLTAQLNSIVIRP
jgi:hypothetical protein